MIPALRRPAGLVLLACAAGLSGCGGAQLRHAGARVPDTVCVDVSLPLRGVDGAAGRGVLAGVRQAIPATGLSIGGARLRICRVLDSSAGDAAVAAAQARIAADPRTVAVVGALDASQAARADLLLAAGGIALITPSGSDAAPAPAPVADATADSLQDASALSTSTTLALLPSLSRQRAAARAAGALHGCGARRRLRPLCSVLAPGAPPLCTGISPRRQGPARFCVMAGPNLSGWPTPALAYGRTAGAIVRTALDAVAASGGEVTRRSAVLAALRQGVVRGTPIGTVRFNASGAITGDEFTAYAVSAGGHLSALESFRAH